MGTLIEQAITIVGPFIMDLIAQWQTRNNTTALPTIEQLQAHGAEILAEGAAWTAAHPLSAPMAGPANAPVDKRKRKK